jgi:hypothetical protein
VLKYFEVISRNLKVMLKFLKVKSKYPEVALRFFQVRLRYLEVGSKYFEVVLKYLEAGSKYFEIRSSYLEVRLIPNISMNDTNPSPLNPPILEDFERFGICIMHKHIWYEVLPGRSLPSRTRAERRILWLDCVDG